MLARDRFTFFGKQVLYHYKSLFSTFQNGNIQLNYVFPIHGHLRGHAQVFQGYGETRYNVSQTTLGIGFHLQIGKEIPSVLIFIKVDRSNFFIFCSNLDFILLKKLRYNAYVNAICF
jgi:hypothetical protein